MLKFIQNNREITALLAVVLLFVLPGFLDRQYLSVQTLTMVYSSAQILILLAMGATLVMLTRNIDVSVGSITGMCAVLLGMLLNAGYSLPVACVATLLLGLLAGFFNGVLVAWLKIPAIVATLGTLGLYRGIMLLWTGGKWIEGLPAELKQLSAPLLFGVSAIGWLTIILVAFMAWLLAKTAFGRSFYATGDNYRALVNWAFVQKPFALWHFVERLHGGTGGDCVCFADWFYPQPDRYRAGDESNCSLRAGRH